MTGQEQLTLNKAFESLGGQISGVRDEIAGLRSDLRVLQDDKVARDAVAAAGTRRSDWDLRLIGLAFVAVQIISAVVLRVIFG